MDQYNRPLYHWHESFDLNVSAPADPFLLSFSLTTATNPSTQRRLCL